MQYINIKRLIIAILVAFAVVLIGSSVLSPLKKEKASTISSNTNSAEEVDESVPRRPHIVEDGCFTNDDFIGFPFAQKVTLRTCNGGMPFWLQYLPAFPLLGVEIAFFTILTYSGLTLIKRT